MTTRRPGGKQRYGEWLVSLKLTLVSVTVVVLLWLVGWFTRAEWPASAAASNRVVVVPTVRPLPTAWPPVAGRPRPVLEPLPAPGPGGAARSFASGPSPLPAPGAAAGSASPGSVSLQMPELKPIPPLPAVPQVPAGPMARTRGS
ncbi:MAG: hypothetical protein M5U01_14240 [Ardenticatenaceae bacterium]|nr:hypothetical protein [Ardenticatenaceae bacterium]